MNTMSPIRRDNSTGFTLVEMMIALTVGLFVLGALVAVISSAARSTKTNDQTSEMQSNGRYALGVILRDVEHAGQAGLTPRATLLSSGLNPTGVVVNNDCDNTDFSLRLGQAVEGSDDNNPYSGTCITAANYSQGDILVVRYADMQTQTAVSDYTAAPTFSVTNDIYLRSSYAVSKLFQNSVTLPTQVGNGPPMLDQLLKTYVYYISPDTSAGDGIPALYRLGLIAGVLTPELVASGIENLQVQYGVVDESAIPPVTQYLNACMPGATSVPSAPCVNTWPSTTFPSWTQVKSVRVWLLARNSDSKGNGGYSNQTSYQMGNVNYVPTVGTNDKFRRQLFMTTISLHN